MPVQPQYLAYALEQLAGIPGLRSRRMFGGVGLYSGDLFFGLIDDDTLFFKTDESNKTEYVARNMPRFMPFPERPDAVMAYHQVPADIIEDAEQLVSWARRSVAVALAAQARKPARKPSRKSAGRAAREPVKKPPKERARKVATTRKRPRAKKSAHPKRRRR